ncbi:hypothetical protein AB0N89_23790 [Amycolatopsis sp. NPDC089917]|uniref:hypothetical protein n=1 Tax=Amycolatopsis sp. NPDC089917 TaxID=3155187 RepID=UPI003442F647
MFLAALWAATDDDYLSESALVICLIIGMVLSHEKDKHANLLKAYGVLPPGTAKAVLATQSKYFDRMHELQGKPLAREETAPQQTRLGPPREIEQREEPPAR